jgi:hypothetical protein
LHLIPNVEAGIAFNCTVSEGAVLVLPEGASSHGLLDDARRQVNDYLLLHQNSLFDFANSLGRYPNNGGVIFVTDCYKAGSWGIAIFQDASNDASFSYKLKDIITGTDDGKSLIYSWDRNNLLDTRVSAWPEGCDEDHPAYNQCVFISGYRIMRRAAVGQSAKLEKKWEPSQVLHDVSGQYNMPPITVF